MDKLKVAFENSDSAESKLSPANQQLALASAWKKVEATITPTIKELRSKNVGLVVDKYGRTKKDSGFTLATEVPQFFKTAIKESVKFADE